ncbi:hypothetical protein [Octadecabacter ascidiaceicola]|uniref:hypothetical protein n=1 Tax=Octadecabacter ascidiaceicola TaxID=1655543 RepID=UPI0027BA5489|nr:hypothetical protein [Octadecabacter ascidiaceicola]
MTERQKDLWVTPETLAKQVDRQVLHDPIDPIYVACMVVFLASDDAGCAVRRTSWSKQVRSRN